MKKLLAIAWLLLAASTARSQAPAPDPRPVPSGKIAWSDFAGEVDANSPYWAHTSWRVNYTYRTVSFRHDTVQLDVQVQPLLLASAAGYAPAGSPMACCCTSRGTTTWPCCWRPSSKSRWAC